MYSGLKRSPLSSGCMGEKGNQEDGGEGCLTAQKEWREGEGQGWKGGGSDNGDCDSECHSVLWCREGARERCSHGGSKNEQGEEEGEDGGWSWHMRWRNSGWTSCGTDFAVDLGLECLQCVRRRTMDVSS